MTTDSDDPNDFDTSDIPTMKGIKTMNMDTETPALIIDGISVSTVNGEIRYEAGAEIDADGAGAAYALPGSGLTGLDYIANALTNPAEAKDPNINWQYPPSGWAGIITNPDKTPFVQIDGPYKGYCLSATALQDHNFSVYDYRRYVQADVIAYISIPPALEALGVRLGDAALVCDRDTAKSIQAVVGDIGPRRKLGEVSIACANGINIYSSPKNGGVSRGVIVRIFPGSAKTPAWDNRRKQTDVAAFVDAFASAA